MVRRAVVISLLTNEELVVKLGNTLGQLDTFSKRIELTKGTVLEKATLVVSAFQTYLSGAEVSVTLNKKVLTPSLNWHAFENKTISKDYDVTDILTLGINEFSGLYKTAYGVLSDNKASVTIVLSLLVNVPDVSSPGVEAGRTTSKDTLRNVGQVVREVLNYIIAAGAIGGVVIAFLWSRSFVKNSKI